LPVVIARSPAALQVIVNRYGGGESFGFNVEEKIFGWEDVC